MPRLNTDPEAITLYDDRRTLLDNAYPGRLILMGMLPDGTYIQTYVLMGRSKPSRDRVLVEESDGIRTIAPGKTAEEMAQTPSAPLIYYKAMQSTPGIAVVSNGAQTEHVLTSVSRGTSLAKAVETAPKVESPEGIVDLSMYEPDGANKTPRITGVIDTRQGALTPFGLSVTRKSRDSDEVIRDTWEADLSDLEPGMGHGVHTYNGDGNPLPSFDREPFAYSLGRSADEVADSLWGDLNPDNRLVLVVRSIGGSALDNEYTFRP